MSNKIDIKNQDKTNPLTQRDDIIYILNNLPPETIDLLMQSALNFPSKKSVIDEFSTKEIKSASLGLENTNQDENNLNKDAKKLAADLEIEKRVTTLETQGGVTSKLTELFNLSLLVSILGLFISYMFVLPNYQIEYNKQISELKTEYIGKINEQQNTINLQQEKIQNLEDDVKDLEDIIKKYFIKEQKTD